MTADITFHYPPELFNLLVYTIPALNRSKKDILLFFRGAGVPDDLLRDLSQRLKNAPDEINKAEISRLTLERLNARGEVTLRNRREVLRRVVGFSNFDACWPNDQLKAKGLVASIRDIVNQKDSFTRMNLAREEESQARLAEAQKTNRAKQEKAAKIDAAKRELYALIGTSLTPQQRGKKLEAALNNLFLAYGILVHEACHLVSESGEGIVQQIDGVIDLKGSLYFVEMKWYVDPVGKPQISKHIVRLMGRAEARGLFISASDYTEPAIHTSPKFLQHKIVALCHLPEIIFLLEQYHDLAEFLIQKIQAAQIHKNPYFKLFDSDADRQS
jgi:restriction system protein